MALTRVQLIQLIQRYQAINALRADLSDKSGSDLYKVSERLMKEMISAVGTGANAEGSAVKSQAQIDKILRSIDRASARAIKKAGADYAVTYRELVEMVSGETPDVYAMAGTRTLKETARAMKATARTFNKKVYAKQFKPGFVDWMNELGTKSEHARGEMEATLLRARTNNWSQRELAEALMESPSFTFEKLPVREAAEKFYNVAEIGEHAALKRRSQVVARTKLTAVHQELNHEWSEELGLNYYINLNTSPVSEECKAANAAGPLTWEEWGEKHGRPPRHPNCDSILVPVLDDTAEELRAEFDALEIEQAVIVPKPKGLPWHERMDQQGPITPALVPPGQGKEYADWLEGLSEDELEALSSWGHKDGPRIMRRYERGYYDRDNLSTSERIEAEFGEHNARMIARLIEDGPVHDGIVYRGDILTQDELDALSVGDHLELEATSSSSVSPELAAVYAKSSQSLYNGERVVYRVEGLKGNAAALNVQNLLKLPGGDGVYQQGEVLLGKGLPLRIKEIRPSLFYKDKNGITKIKKGTTEIVLEYDPGKTATIGVTGFRHHGADEPAVANLATMAYEANGPRAFFTMTEPKLKDALDAPGIKIRSLRRGTGLYASDPEPTHLLRVAYEDRTELLGRIARYAERYNQDSFLLTQQADEETEGATLSTVLKLDLDERAIEIITEVGSRDGKELGATLAKDKVTFHHITEWNGDDDTVTLTNVQDVAEALTKAGYEINPEVAWFTHDVIERDDYAKAIEAGRKKEGGGEDGVSKDIRTPEGSAADGGSGGVIPKTAKLADPRFDEVEPIEQIELAKLKKWKRGGKKIAPENRVRLANYEAKMRLLADARARILGDVQASDVLSKEITSGHKGKKLLNSEELAVIEMHARFEAEAIGADVDAYVKTATQAAPYGFTVKEYKSGHGMKQIAAKIIKKVKDSEGKYGTHSYSITAEEHTLVADAAQQEADELVELGEWDEHEHGDAFNVGAVASGAVLEGRTWREQIEHEKIREQKGFWEEKAEAAEANAEHYLTESWFDEDKPHHLKENSYNSYIHELTDQIQSEYKAEDPKSHKIWDVPPDLMKDHLVRTPPPSIVDVAESEEYMRAVGKLSQDDLDTIRHWGNGSMKVRKIQQGEFEGSKEDREAFTELGEDLEYITRHKLPQYKGDVYRGFPITRKEIEALTVGDVHETTALNSTTALRSVAALFSRMSADKYNEVMAILKIEGIGVPLSVKYKVPQGPGAVIIQHLTDYPNEWEILVGKGLKYRIKEVRKLMAGDDPDIRPKVEASSGHFEDREVIEIIAEAVYD